MILLHNIPKHDKIREMKKRSVVVRGQGWWKRREESMTIKGQNKGGLYSDEKFYVLTGAGYINLHMQIRFLNKENVIQENTSNEEMFLYESYRQMFSIEKKKKPSEIKHPYTHFEKLP